jgi:hypothetical protein
MKVGFEFKGIKVYRLCNSSVLPFAKLPLPTNVNVTLSGDVYSCQPEDAAQLVPNVIAYQEPGLSLILIEMNVGGTRLIFDPPGVKIPAETPPAANEIGLNPATVKGPRASLALAVV